MGSWIQGFKNGERVLEASGAAWRERVSLSQARSSNNAAFGGGRGNHLITEIRVDDACKVFGNFRIVNAV